MLNSNKISSYKINGENVPMDIDDASVAYNIIKGYNSRTIKVTIPKFLVDLSFVVISIVCKFHNIWLGQT